MHYRRGLQTGALMICGSAPLSQPGRSKNPSQAGLAILLYDGIHGSPTSWGTASRRPHPRMTAQPPMSVESESTVSGPPLKLWRVLRHITVGFLTGWKLSYDRLRRRCRHIHCRRRYFLPPLPLQTSASPCPSMNRYPPPFPPVTTATC